VRTYFAKAGELQLQLRPRPLEVSLQSLNLSVFVAQVVPQPVRHLLHQALGLVDLRRHTVR